MAEQSRAEKLLADMDAKYGKTPPTTPAATPTPAPQAPTVPVSQPASGTSIQGAAGMLGNRNKQIDKAAGYACGGKIKAHAQGGKVKAHVQGGKILGPGTPTSDSIPAQVAQTGEPLLVSNNERIVSAKQDEILQRIAEMLGFKTVDEMFAQLTGEPVGPTMKDGVPAAADGRAPWYEEDPLTALSSAVTKSMASSKGAEDYQKSLYPKGTFDSAQTPSATPSPLLGPQNTFGQTSNVSRITLPGQGFMSGAEPGKAPVPVVQPGRNEQGTITADSAAAAYGNNMQRPGGVFGTMDLANQNERMAKSLGYAGADDFNKQFAQKYSLGGSDASLLPSDATLPGGLSVADWNNRVSSGFNTQMTPAQKTAYLAAEQNQNIQRTGQAIQADEAAQRNQTIRRGQDLNLQGDLARAAKDPLEQRINALKLGDAERISTLRGITMNAKSKEEQDAAIAKLNALEGRNGNKATAHVVGGGTDEMGKQLPQFLAVTDQNGRLVGGGSYGDLQKQMQARSSGAPHPDGTRLQKIENGKQVFYVVKNGVPVKEGT